jgi:hypothetical protein
VASRVEGGQFMHNNIDQDTVEAAVLYINHLIIRADEGLIGQIEDWMNKMFRMNDHGSVFFNLGINIELNGKH